MELALNEEAGAVNIMHHFYSEDLENWTHRGRKAWGVASLGLAIDSEQNLLLTLIQEVRPPSWFEEHLGPPIYGFLYDGESLHPKSWSVEDEATKAYIDPQMFNGQMSRLDSKTCQF